MALKRKYSFEVQDSKWIMGGEFPIPEMMTEYQAYTKAVKMGREFLRNAPHADSYHLYIISDDDLIFSVEVNRNGRKLDARVWDCRSHKFVLDTQNNRIQRLLDQCDRHIEAMNSYSEALSL